MFLLFIFRFGDLVCNVVNFARRESHKYKPGKKRLKAKKEFQHVCRIVQRRRSCKLCGERLQWGIMEALHASYKTTRKHKTGVNVCVCAFMMDLSVNAPRRKTSATFVSGLAKQGQNWSSKDLSACTHYYLPRQRNSIIATN